MTDQTAEPSQKNENKFDFVINRRSGTVLQDGEKLVEKNLREAFGESAGNISFIDGGEVSAAVRQWSTAHKGDGRRLIIGGGDGSVLSAAAELLDSDIALGILPLGTNNLVARELGFSPDYKKAAAQYKDSVAQKIDVGTVNGRHFLYGLVIGNSVNFFEARENVRSNKFLKAAKHAFSFASGVTIGRRTTLNVSGTEIKSRVFAVTNNAISPRPNKNGLKLSQWKEVVGNSFSKTDLDSGEAAFYTTTAGALKAPSVALSILKGTWDKRKDVKIQKAPQLLIDRVAGPGSKKKETTIVLDGEIVPAQYPLDVRILPKALTVLKPGSPAQT